MAGFDKMRFAESLMAAILGAAVHSRYENGPRSDKHIGVAQKFQRALLLATSYTGFTEPVSVRYLSRISALPLSQRPRYMRITFQPSDIEFDEKLTSLFIFEHALKSDSEWHALIIAFNLDQPDAAEKAYDEASRASKMAADRLFKAKAQLDQHLAESARRSEEKWAILPRQWDAKSVTIKLVTLPRNLIIKLLGMVMPF